MRRRILLLLTVVAALGWGRALAADRPVLVELFTSEGCSSCPPADALALRLEREQPAEGARIIVLAHHVSYWDRLGWRDPFSSVAATTRQKSYASAFRRDPYTPQLVIDGRVQMVGSRDVAAIQAIRDVAAAPKARVQISVRELAADRWEVRVQVSEIPERDEAHYLYLAVTEQGLGSDVSSGENAGRYLEHAAVVRSLMPIGRLRVEDAELVKKEKVSLGEGWERSRLRLVAFVQGVRSLRVIGAGIAPAPGGPAVEGGETKPR